MNMEGFILRMFINLAEIGRSDWRSVVLTFLLVRSINLLFAATSAIVVTSSTFLEHGILYIPSSLRKTIFEVVDAIGYIFGLWLACKKIMKRPFRSPISTDMTFDIRRCFLGAALYFAANAISFMTISLFTSMRAGAWVFTPRQFE
jgi:uncharacterized protein